MFARHCLAAALALTVVVPATAADANTPPARAEYGPWGLDLAGMDRTVKPGDDFFRYGGGSWLRNNPIPPDRTIWGPFFILRARAEADVKTIVDAVVSQPQAPGSEAEKIARYYAAYLDTDAIAGAGLTSAKADLAAISAVRTYEDVARLMARKDVNLGGPFGFEIWPDPKNPQRYTVNISQSGLSLPDRDYYLTSDIKAAALRDQYRAYVGKMLALAAYPDPAGSADAILALETAIAQHHWPAAQRDDRDLTYNPRTRAELEAFAPDYPWGKALAQLEIVHQDFFVLKEPDAIQAMARLMRATPLETWRAYMTFHYLNDAAEVLPAAFDDLAFDFNGRTLSGQPRQRERWKRATTALNAALGEAVGKLYVRSHFTPEAKAQMVQLVENLRSAFRSRISGVDWMSPETKQAALRKLAKMRVKIGYPDRWRDYSTLEVRAGDPLGNRGRARSWDWRRKAARLDGPTDHDEWGMTPQTVNAYYNAFYNEIVFPAAILQPPYFDPCADPAVNYGGIGGVIGHEMSHGFDDQGSKSDENGVLRNWWRAQDVVRFKARVAGLSRQYAAYEPLPGLHLDGNATLGENIGDNSGLAIALEAYRISLHGRSAPVLDGFTSLQRFFLSWAQTYRESERDEEMRKDVATDPHSPAEFRVNGVVRNLDAWYDAFGVRPDDAYYLAPAQRVRLW